VLILCIQVDKKILGGFIIEFPDRLVDMSTTKKLEEFNNLVAKLESA
jgi:F-type H+-transporting ATPase subunit O